MNDHPNILLISGSGRNVGKTTFACEIIQRISRERPVIAIKITPHRYDHEISGRTIFHSDDISIFEELTKNSEKDSSRMLNAGAHKVYFIQSEDRFIPQAMQKIPEQHMPVICESGGAGKFIKAGLLIFLTNNMLKNSDIEKRYDLNVQLHQQEFAIHKIIYDENCWKIK